MTIKTLGRDELDQIRKNRLKAELKKIKKIEAETVEYIKSVLNGFIEIEDLYAVKDYIDLLVKNWNPEEIEEEEEDIEDND